MREIKGTAPNEYGEWVQYYNDRGAEGDAGGELGLCLIFTGQFNRMYGTCDEF